MTTTLKIKNYRSIGLASPVELELKDGITFILGMNNIGKSNIIRSLFELRTVFSECSRRGGPSIFPITVNTHFDEMVSRRGSQHPISIEIKNEHGLARIQIRPEHDYQPHTVSLKIEITYQNAQTRFHPSFLSTSKMLADTMYLGAFRGADHQVSGTFGDMSVGQQFNAQWSGWAGGDNVSSRERIEELESELKLLLGFQRFAIRLNDTKNTLLVTTDEGQFKLNELGGGVSQLIMTLGNAAIRNPSYVLIDEPEIGLHPRMQEILVRALAAKAKNGLIASSHSVGLARSTADQILSLTSLPSGGLHLGPFGEHYQPTIAQSINELGYSQFVEIGGNNILLVEGRTDVKALREVLRKYGIETSFIILPFGGREFIIDDEAKIVDELAEIKRLNPKSISVIFDSDASEAGQILQGRHATFMKVTTNLGFNAFATDRAATENYISQSALDAVFGEGRFVALAAYEQSNQRPNGNWDKNKNWLLLREMSLKDFEGTGLDVFIKQTLVPLSQK